jgi:tetratricopeptide (TPR) repeat protein
LSYLAAITFYILSLLSKPMGLSLPFLLLLLDYHQSRPWHRNVFYEKVPFLAFSMIFGLISLTGQQAGGAMGSREVLALDNLLYAAYSLLFYLAVFFVPVNYSAFYPYPDHVPFVFIFLALGLIALLIYFRKQKDFFFGSAFFLLIILPVIKVVPFGNYIAADRLMYVPSIGLSFLIGWLWLRLGAASARIARFKTPVFFLMAAGIVVLFIWLSRDRLPVWHDSGTLWEDVLQRHSKVALAHANLGAFYGEKDRLDEAIVQLQKALALDPNYAKAHYNLAVAYLRKNESALAMKHFERAVTLGYKFTPEIMKMLKSSK